MSEHHAALGLVAKACDERAGSLDELTLVLRERLRADAVQVVGWEAERLSHTTVATMGYAPAVTEHLRLGMMDADFFGLVRGAPLPLSMDCDGVPIDFRATWHFLEILGPAGFDDGLSGALVSTSGRYVGMLHASADRRHHFRRRDQELVAAVGPLLAEVVDAELRRSRTSVTSKIIYDPCGPISVGDLTPEIDPLTFRPLAEAFLRSGLPAVRFLAQGRSGWLSAELVMMSGACGPVATLSWQPTELPAQLTAREIAVLTHLAMGDSNRRIAADFGISVRTITTHVDRILEKLGCESRAGAAGRAVRDGLIVPQPHGTLDRVSRFLLGVEKAGPMAIGFYSS